MSETFSTDSLIKEVKIPHHVYRFVRLTLRYRVVKDGLGHIMLILGLRGEVQNVGFNRFGTPKPP